MSKVTNNVLGTINVKSTNNVLGPINVKSYNHNKCQKLQTIY